MIIFYTDPHLGLSRASNTTPTSSLKLRDILYHQALSIVERQGTKVCLGDLLDKFSNPEEVQVQAADIYSNTNIIIAGNHDVTNQKNKIGTLSLLSNLLDCSDCVIAEFGKPMSKSYLLDNTAFLTLVPHAGLQEIFVESLSMAVANVGTCPQGATKFLLLHCNYNMPEDRLTETTLNLTPERVDQLLQHYDYVMLGHEHGPSEHFDGRLVILGNIHPTGLGDISDKRIAIFEEGKLRFEKVWYATTGYAEFDCQDIPESTATSFVRVKGLVPAGGMLELTKSISTMWKRSPKLYCVKMEVNMPAISVGVDNEGVQQSINRLPDMINKELAEYPEMKMLWDQLLREEER